MNDFYGVLNSLDLTLSARDVFGRIREAVERVLDPSWLALLHEDSLEGVFQLDPHFSTGSFLALLKKRELPMVIPTLLDGHGGGAPEILETSSEMATEPLAQVVGRNRGEIAEFLSSTGTQRVYSAPVHHRERRYGYLLFGSPQAVDPEQRKTIEGIRALMSHVCYVYEVVAYERTRSAAFGAAQLPSMVSSPSGRILEVNEAFVRFFGLQSRQEAEGLGVDEIFALHAEETLPQLFRKEHLARPVVASPPGSEQQVSGVLHSVAGATTPPGASLRYFYFMPDKPSYALTGHREPSDRHYPRLELPRELSLTAREIDVAVRIAAGESSKEIARRLNVSIRTVQFHRQSLRDKLDIVGRGLSLRHALLKYEKPHS